MPKILVIEEFYKIPFLHLDQYDEIFGPQAVLDRLKTTAKKTPTPADMMTARAYLRSDFAASILGEEVLHKVVNLASLKPLKKVGTGSYPLFVAKTRFLNDLSKAIKSFFYVKRVIKQFKIEGPADFIPALSPYKTFMIVKNKQPDAERFCVPWPIRLYFKAYLTLKNIYFLFKFIFLPEILMLKMRGKPQKISAAIKSYPIGVNVDVGRAFGKGYVGIDFFIDGKKIKKEDVLFVFDEEQPQHCIQEAKETGYNIVNFYDDLVTAFSVRRFFKKLYPTVHTLRWELVVLWFKNPYLAFVYFMSLRDYILWEIFYQSYSVKKFFCMQHPGQLTRTACPLRHGAKTIFAFGSIMHLRLDHGAHPDINEKIYYSHLIFDEMISDKVTNIFFQHGQNEISRYIDNGSLFSDYVFKARTTRAAELRKKLGVPEGLSLVPYFDNTAGLWGVLNYADVVQALKDLVRLLEENPNIYLAFREKKGTRMQQYKHQEDIMAAYAILKSHPRFCYTNDIDITLYELMAAAHLVIASPLSSAIYEAVVGGVRTVCYEPFRRYAQSYLITEQMPRFSAHGYAELADLVKYWLFVARDADFVCFQNDWIKKHIDPFCDGQAIERFRDYLVES